MFYDHDAYVIHLRKPSLPNNDQLTTLTARSDVIFRLQKYHFQKSKQVYRPVFRRDVPLHLHIHDLTYDLQKNCNLPVLFDARPRLPLPNSFAIDARSDPVIGRLSEHLRLVFRYDPVHDVGCLLHFGYDFAMLDESPLLYLWQSADCCEQERILQELAQAAEQQDVP